MISASMPAGAGVIPEQVKPLNDYVNVYDEELRDDGAGRGLGFAHSGLDVAAINLSNVGGALDGRSLEASNGDIRTSVDTLSNTAEMMFNPHASLNSVVPPWNPVSRGPRDDGEQGTYRADLNHPAFEDVRGRLGIGHYYVRSNTKGSYAELDSASGWVRANRFGLVSDMGNKGLVSAVNRHGAAARTAVTIEDFQINLNDIFQQARVELPLGLTLNIATQVALPGGETAMKAYERLLLTEERLQVINGMLAEVDSVRADLEPFMAKVPGYDAAKAELARLEAVLWEALNHAQKTADALIEAIAKQEQVNAAVTAANTMLGAVTQDIATMQSHIDATKASIDRWRQTINNLELEKQALLNLPGGEGGNTGGNVGGGAGQVNLPLLSAKKAKRSPSIVNGHRVRSIPRYRSQRTMVDVLQELQNANETLSALTKDLANLESAKAVMDALRNTHLEDLNALNEDKNAADEAVLLAQIADELADRDLGEVSADVEEAADTIDEMEATLGEADAVVQKRLDRLEKLRLDLDPALLELRTLLADMAAMVPIYQGLTDALEPWPLFKIKAISYELTTQISDQGTDVRVRCGLEGVELLGEDLSINTCEDLRGARTLIEDSIREFLAQFTVTPPEVRLDVPTATVAYPFAGEGRTRAQSSLTPLRLVIKPFQVRDLADPLMDSINKEIDALQASQSMREIRDIVRRQPPALPSVSWVLDWARQAKESRDRHRMEMYRTGAPTSLFSSASAGPSYRLTANEDTVDQNIDRELDNFQEDANQAAGNDEVGGQGTSGVDSTVGGMDTDVMWAGCEGCPPPCAPGDPDCADPCLPGNQDCSPPCDPYDVICTTDCTPGDPDCPEPCLPGATNCSSPCVPGTPDCPDVCPPGAVNCVNGGGEPAGDGSGVGGDGSGGSGNGGNGGGSDGLLLGDVNPNANLPHTGGQPGLLGLGLLMLVCAGLLRGKRTQPEG